MKVGDYVRTDIGEIRKVVRVTDDLYVLDKDVVFAHKDKIKKSSPNIIDLIEVGDIIRGKDNHLFEVYAVGSDCVYINNLEEFVLADEVKSILTKEQFESMEYKVC